MPTLSACACMQHSLSLTGEQGAHTLLTGQREREREIKRERKEREKAWTNFSLQDESWAEFSTLEVAAVCIPCTYCRVLQYNLTES